MENSGLWSDNTQGTAVRKIRNPLCYDILDGTDWHQLSWHLIIILTTLRYPAQLSPLLCPPRYFFAPYSPFIAIDCQDRISTNLGCTPVILPCVPILIKRRTVTFTTNGFPNFDYRQKPCLVLATIFRRRSGTQLGGGGHS